MTSTGVILDSGGVLIRPIGGQWFPPAAFGEVLVSRGITYDESLLPAALSAAWAYLDEVHSTPLIDESGERAQFVEYHRRLLAGVEAVGDRTALAEEIDALNRSRLRVEVFDWTVPVLQALAERAIPVVILSDAWPSLRRHYRELGLDNFIRGMVISAEEGMSKPHPAVYAKAMELLGSDTAAFVDDWVGNVRAGNAVGLRGIHLLHADDEADGSLETIGDLTELLQLI